MPTLAYRRRSRPQPRRLVDQHRLTRSGKAIVQFHACTQLGELRFARYALHLNEINLGLLVRRIGDTMLQTSVVGQHQQALAVCIQTARSIHLRYGDEFGQRALSGLA